VKIFLDTAEIAEIRWAAGAGLIDGVTTNPTLLSRAAGADIATLPAAVLRQMLLHPLTDRGVDQFLSDWSKLGHHARAEGTP